MERPNPTRIFNYIWQYCLDFNNGDTAKAKIKADRVVGIVITQCENKYRVLVQ